MAKAKQYISTERPRTSSPDPVVELARQLRRVLDADDEADRQSVRDKACWDERASFGDWIDTVERMISFTQATTLQGAFVQLVLSFDALDDMIARMEQGDDEQGVRRRRAQVDRLLRSVAGAMVKSLEQADPDVRALVDSYSPASEHSENWLTKAELMADAGRAHRLSKAS